MGYRPPGSAAVAGALLALATLAACAASEPATVEPRIAPPHGLPCPRNHLTSYAGIARTVHHDATATRLTITTDWGTTESVAVAHDGREDAQRHFLLAGKPFTAADWPRIEGAPGHIASGLRVVAWVCEDGRTPPVIDWRPGAPAAGRGR
jgi:hypothetical protein